jgi:hypothetical protein
VADVTVITTGNVTVPVVEQLAGVDRLRRRSTHVGPGEPVTLTKDAADRLIRLGRARKPEQGEPGAPKRSAAKREDT